MPLESETDGRLPDQDSSKAGFSRQDASLPKKDGKKPETSGPFCGLFCLLALAGIYDMDVDPSFLIKPEFLGSADGSTLGDLRTASEKLGLHAKAYKRLSYSTLKASPYRMILHVKKDPSESSTYDHYILFLGMEGDMVKIYDPPNPPEKIPIYRLAQRWNGYGLAVSREPIGESAPATVRLRGVLKTAVAFAFLFIVGDPLRRLFRHKRPHSLRWSAATIQCCIIMTVAVIGGTAYHRFNTLGLLAHEDSVRPIQEAHSVDFLKKISEADMRRHLKTKDATFVDARYPEDFRKGNIEGSVNIPTYVEPTDIPVCLGNTPKDSPIVIYCQSASCPFAGVVAKKLMKQGYENVSIFKGGWQGWTAGRKGRE